MAKSKERPAPSHAVERREFQRFEIDLPGHLFVPAQEDIMECQVLNLSGGGALIRCAEPPALLTYIVLYIDGFGRFEGVTSRFVEDDLAVRFFCKEAQAKRLMENLTSFVTTGIKDVTRLRRHAREAGATSGYFVTRDGKRARCDILDLSLQGMSLKSDVRPPLDEVVSLGKYHGRVIRHHQDGFAIQFLEVAASSEPDEDEAPLG